MKIRRAIPADLPQLQRVFRAARQYKAATGNPNQWGGSYPPRELLERDIQQGNCHVCLNEDGGICGVFVLILGEDPTYQRIEDGIWLSGAPYGTLHRVASDGTTPGVFAAALEYSRGVISNLRIDTHADNQVMQALILNSGFRRCGIIYAADGSPRIAYQWIKEAPPR